MCGILGYFTQKSDLVCDKRVHNSLGCLQHRGPDDFGIQKLEISSGILLLAHKRLSIIDLSERGKQPMSSLDGRFLISYNGEIYNYIEIKEKLTKKGYSFRSDTDTEVLINAWDYWGVDCLDIIDGMFSFSLYDHQSKNLFLVRDAFGIKPLYYSIIDSSIYFCSESQALVELIPNKVHLDLSQVYNYLHHGLDSLDETTYYDEIKQLLPGTYLKVNLQDKISIERIQWWNPSFKKIDIGWEESKEKLRYLFLDSVMKQLRSDVPLGAALSGGIDSSSIVSAVKYLRPDIELNTFSYVAENSIVNEEKWIDIVAKSTNSKSHKVIINSDKMISDLDEFISAQGEPILGLSYYAEFSVYRLAKKHGIKVMLDGHGADEALCGYNGYPLFRSNSLFNSNEYFKLLLFLYHWSKWPGRSRNDVYQILIQILYDYKKKSDDNLLFSSLKKLRDVFKNGEKTYQIKSNDQMNLLHLKNNHSADVYINQDLLDCESRCLIMKLYEHLTRSSCPPQLRGADRSAMFRSIENRVPFLSKDLVSFLLTLPEEYLISNKGRTKHIFRDAMTGIVPNEILNRKDKIGYAIPPNFNIAVSKELTERINGSLERAKFINKKNVLSLLKFDRDSIEISDGDSWRYFNFLLWLDNNHNITIGD